jgi:hypothetical protein
MNDSNEEGTDQTTHDANEENDVLQETYKEITGAKTKRSRGYGYMSNQNKAKFLHDRFKEQEREIQRLKQQVELQALEKEEDRAQLAATIRASVMKEVQAMFAQNSNQGILSQVSIHLFCLMLDNMTINI